jgi:hypothetical protein
MSIEIDENMLSYPDYPVGAFVKAKPATNVSIPICGRVIANTGRQFTVKWDFHDDLTVHELPSERFQ